MALSENRAANQKILTASNDTLEECSICYDPFTNKAFASDCLHNFCYQCIYTWVQLRATCPLCLQPITSIIKNVRSIDDYDIEQVAPPQIDVFADYMTDFSVPDDDFGFGYDSDIDDESMSMASDHLDFYNDVSSDDNENLQSAPNSSQGSSSQESSSPINVFDGFALDDEFGSDVADEEDEVAEGPFSENLASSSEDEKDDDENGDNDGNDENHSENEEFFEENDDEDYDYDDHNNDEDDDDNDNCPDFSEAYSEDDDEDIDRLSVPCYSFSSECDSEERYEELGYDFSKCSDSDDSDSDPDYSSPFTASHVYSCDYY